MSRDRNVQQTTSGRFQRRARMQQVWEKKYQGRAIASRFEPVTRLVTDQEVEEELARQFEMRSLTSRLFHRISFTTMAAVASRPPKTGVAKQLPAGRRVSPHTN